MHRGYPAEFHIKLPDDAGQKLRQIARAERRSISAQVCVVVEQEWAAGGYETDEDKKRNDAA